MGTMLIDDVASESLDQLKEEVERANLRLAWRMRFWNFLHGHLTLAQHSQLQAECLRAFGPRWREEIGKEEDRQGRSKPGPQYFLKTEQF